MDITKKFEETLQSFIQQVQKKLNEHQTTLQEYEDFFTKFEEVFPSYSAFVARALDSIHVIENIEKQLAEKISHHTGEAVSESVSVAKTPRKERTAPHSPVSAETKKVLIVDDAEINRVLMGHYFKHLPVKLEFSGSGADAIQKCQAKKYDLILMDLQMKGMGGLEATKKIREFEKQSPIFAISNLVPSETERVESLEAGCTSYLSKASTKESLIDQVTAQLFGE